MPVTAPDRTEAAPYYFTYIDKVPAGDICTMLETQASETIAALSAISEDRSLYRYAPDKWSIRQMIHHVNDGERVFAFRAMWFARTLGAELPSFEQDIAVTTGGAEQRSWQSIVLEFAAVRAASIAFFKTLPDEAWPRHGVASGNPVTVRALAYIIAGHAAHHMQILKERYVW
jgi:hypothetical protein